MISAISRPLGDFLVENSQKVEVVPTDSYPMAGISSYAQGLFDKPSISGTETGYKFFHRIEPQQVVLSKLKGWEGAITVAGEAFAGRFLPPHNLLFDVDKSAVEVGYIGWAIRRSNVWASLKRASRGMGARRETVNANDLLSICIPVPPIVDQRAIVEKLERAASSVKRIQTLQSGIANDLTSLIVRCNEWNSVHSCQLGRALELDEDRVPLAQDTSYPQIGIRGFGGGLFRKAGVTGAETTYRHFNRLSSGQFVVSQVKGWEGAVAVCDSEHAGLYASPEYRTFRCNPQVLRPAYFSYLCRTPWFHAKLAPATRGQGARRERLRPEMLQAISIPLPSVEIQEALEAAFAKVERAVLLSKPDDLDHLLPAMLNDVFG